MQNAVYVCPMIYVVLYKVICLPTNSKLDPTIHEQRSIKKANWCFLDNQIKLFFIIRKLQGSLDADSKPNQK
jgi:hypothetical protein